MPWRAAPFGTGPSSTWTGNGGEKTEISGIDLSLKNLSLPAAPDTPLSKGISFAGALRVKEIKGKDLALTDLDAKITASAGVYDIRPFTMKLFGGKGEGGIRVDLLRRHVEVSGFVLEKPVIRIEKGTDGKFNFETPPRPRSRPRKGGEGPGISLTVASGAVRTAASRMWTERRHEDGRSPASTSP